MIQDILPLTMRNQYERKVPGAADRVLSFCEDSIFVREGQRTDYLRYGELADWCRMHGEQLPDTVYLFAVGARVYFLAKLPEAFVKAATEKGFAFVRMFEMRRRQPKESVFAAATAWHLYGWYRDNRFCGRCGRRLLHSETLRMLSCPCCGNQVFPKIVPAVIVGVTKGEYILLTKYARREYRRYALIAGFTEIGETAEQTVEREALEETGLKVSGIRYYGSQPWGFDSNLLLGYFCEVKDEGEIHLDEQELASAEWVHYSRIPNDEEGLSLTREMMCAFRDRFRK